MFTIKYFTAQLQYASQVALRQRYFRNFGQKLSWIRVHRSSLWRFQDGEHRVKGTILCWSAYFVVRWSLLRGCCNWKYMSIAVQMKTPVLTGADGRWRLAAFVKWIVLKVADSLPLLPFAPFFRNHCYRGGASRKHSLHGVWVWAKMTVGSGHTWYSNVLDWFWPTSISWTTSEIRCVMFSSSRKWTSLLVGWTFTSTERGSISKLIKAVQRMLKRVKFRAYLK